MLHICFIMHATRSSNLGVGALTAAQVETLRMIAKELGQTVKMTILDWADTGFPCVSGPDLDIITVSGRDLLSPGGVLKYMRAADLVIDIGAGDSFADIYGPKRLRRMMWLKLVCLGSGTPLVHAPQTYGPFTSRVSKFLAKHILNRSELIFARDVASAVHLRALGLKREVLVGSDVALRLPGVPRVMHSDRPRVGLNISGLLLAGGYTGRNQFGMDVDYEALCAELIERFLAHPDQPEVHLIPHVISPDIAVEDDVSAIHQFAERYPQVICAPAFKTPSEAKGYIAQMSFFSGARMHACIAAFSSGVAVVPLAYSRKFAGLFGALGYGHVADCCAHSQGEIVDRVMNGYNHRHEVSAQAKEAYLNGLARLQLYETSLGRLLQDLSTDKKKPDAKAAPGLEESLALK
ncbi:MAG: polysaccharide pyruvyl transferase family protein [Pseudomonadota bacterium]